MNNDLILTISVCTCGLICLIVISIITLVWAYKSQISYILIVWKLLKEIWNLLRSPKQKAGSKTSAKRQVEKQQEVEDAEFTEIKN